MTLRITLNLDDVTWSELITFIDLARTTALADNLVEYEPKGSDSRAAMVVTLPGRAVSRGPAVINAGDAAAHAAVLTALLLDRGDAGAYASELQHFIDLLQ